jgi:hypothetical protein
VYSQSANLFVLVTVKTVDGAGVVRGTAVTGTQVELGGSGYQLESSNPQVTDGNGVAQWRVRCQLTGTQQLSVSVDNGPTMSLQLPACVSPGTSETTTSSSTSTTRRTTTSRRGV